MTMPAVSSATIASLTAGRLTPRLRAISDSAGKRPPTAMSWSRMKAATWAAISS